MKRQIAIVLGVAIGTLGLTYNVVYAATATSYPNFTYTGPNFTATGPTATLSAGRGFIYPSGGAVIPVGGGTLSFTAQKTTNPGDIYLSLSLVAQPSTNDGRGQGNAVSITFGGWGNAYLAIRSSTDDDASNMTATWPANLSSYAGSNAYHLKTSFSTTTGAQNYSVSLINNVLSVTLPGIITLVKVSIPQGHPLYNFTSQLYVGFGGLNNGNIAFTNIAVAPAVTTVATLTTAQLQALSMVELSIAIATLSPDQIAVLTPAQIQNLTSAQISALTTAQVAALTTAQIIVLTAAQLSAFTQSQIAVLSLAQIQAFSSS